MKVSFCALPKSVMAGRSNSLRSDLRAVHGAVGELLNSVCPDVPSWRFPGRLSSSLSLEDLLDTDEVVGDERIVMLEGLVDRLLLLLQTGIKLWNETGEERRPSNSLPLSLPSAAKKFSRKLLQSRHKISELQTQLMAKEEEASRLRAGLKERDEQCQLLQTALEHSRVSSSSSHYRPTSGELPCMVPYEARNTLRLSRLQSSHSDRQPSTNPYSQTQQPKISLSLVPAASTTAVAQSLPGCASVTTQTVETAFAMCVRCSSTQKALSFTSKSLQELCQSLNISSHLSGTDWDEELEIDPIKWREMVSGDLKSINEVFRVKENEVMSLKECVAGCYSHEDELNSKLVYVTSQLSLLQDSTADAERNHARQLASCREAGLAQVRETETALRNLLNQRNKLEDQLAKVEKEKENIKASSDYIEKQQERVQAELKEVRNSEKRLIISQQRLMEQQEKLGRELVQSRESLQNERLELNKTSALHRSLQAKHEAVLSRQKKVLERLGEMDQETKELRKELVEAEKARDQLICKTEELQMQCSSLQSQVLKYEEKLSLSVEEKEKMREELTALELQLSSLTTELEKEKESCRLLVTHPETKSTDPGSSRDIQKHISANTIRILLLEEQNMELRDTMTDHISNTTATRKSNKLSHPLALWHSDSVASFLLSQKKFPLTRPPTAQQKTSTSPASSSFLRAPL